MKCPKCGKLFNLRGGPWGYKYDRDYCCTYSCMMAMYYDELEEIMTDEQKEQIISMNANGASDSEIAAKLGLTTKQIYNYRYNRKRQAPTAGEAPADKPQDQQKEIQDHEWQIGKVPVKPAIKTAEKNEHRIHIDDDRVISLLDRILDIIEIMVGKG